MARVWVKYNDAVIKQLRFEDDVNAANSIIVKKKAPKNNALSWKTSAALFACSVIVSCMLYQYFEGAEEDEQLSSKVSSHNASQIAQLSSQQNTTKSEGARSYRLLRALAVGVGTIVYTCQIIYLDSRVPGVNPPTPSPRRCRRGIYFEFHLAYAMAVANGIVFFCISFWDL